MKLDYEYDGIHITHIAFIPEDDLDRRVCEVLKFQPETLRFGWVTKNGVEWVHLLLLDRSGQRGAGLINPPEATPAEILKRIIAIEDRLMKMAGG